MINKARNCFEYNGSIFRKGVMITGMPTEEELESLFTNDVGFEQLDITERVIIPEVKPDVEQIQSMHLKTCVVRAWAATSAEKVMIDGLLTQKITYTACDSKQSVHTVEFQTHFSHFVDVDSTFALQGIDLTRFIVFAPRDAFIEIINGRELFKNILIESFFIPFL